MRFDILALAFVGVGSLAVAAAADPAPATPPERAAASAPAATDAAPVSTSAATKVPAPTTASSPAASPTAASELSTAEQRLISLGYKPQMRNGEKIYCRREAALGSRISASQHCGTVGELSTTTQLGKDYLEKTQRTQLNPVGH